MPGVKIVKVHGSSHKTVEERHKYAGNSRKNNPFLAIIISLFLLSACRYSIADDSDNNQDYSSKQPERISFRSAEIVDEHT